MAELDALISSRSVRVRSLIIEGSHLDPRVMQRFQARERVLLRKLQLWLFEFPDTEIRENSVLELNLFFLSSWFIAFELKFIKKNTRVIKSLI